MTLLQAIARMEGWLEPDSLCRINHNPGNIEYGRFAVAHGATRANGRFAYFPDDETGFRAMSALLQAPTYKGLTVAQAIHRWAPPNENDTDRYIQLVCQWSGHVPTDSLADALMNDVFV